MADRVTKSVWFRIACFLISLAFLYLAGRGFQTNAPISVEGSEPSIGGHATFSVDRSVVIFPGDCATFSWKTSAVREVRYNSKSAATNQSDTVCLTPWTFPEEKILAVTYLNGARQILTITPKILSLQPKTWLYPFLTLLALLGAIQPWRRFPMGKRLALTGVVALCIFLSAITVSIQIGDKTFDYVMSNQFQSHEDLLNGSPNFNQWQYRVLSDYVAEGAIRVGDHFGVGYPAVFTMMRLAQNALLFMLAAYYFHILGSSRQIVLIGLMLASWAIVDSNYDLALVFDTFGDVIFYLIAVILIVKQKFIWIIPVTLLASLNRETSGLIPVLLLASQIRFRPLRLDRRVILIGTLSMLVWIAVQIAVRDLYGWHPGQGVLHHNLGLEMIGFNLSREISWRELFSTLNLVPLLALFQLRRTSPLLRRFFWALVPLWVIIHFAAGIVAESRLFLVPMIVVLVPMVLTGISQVGKPTPARDGITHSVESEQAGTLSRSLPEPEAG